MKYLEPEEVVPGMIGFDYNDEPATVILIQQIKQMDQRSYSKFLKFDDSGVLPNSYDELLISATREENDELPEGLETWLVAVEDETKAHVVFAYHDSGFMVPTTERWKNSKKLLKVNKNVGVLENLKHLKKFRNF